MREGSVTLSIVFSVNIVVWPLPTLASAPVIGVVSILNLASSFSCEHKGCTFVVLVFLLRGLRNHHFQVIIRFTNVCKFLSYSYTLNFSF